MEQLRLFDLRDEAVCLFDRWIRTETRLSWPRTAEVGTCARKAHGLSQCLVCPARAVPLTR